MPQTVTRVLIAGLAFALGLSAPATQARADWDALVIGQPGAGAETAFADAFHITATLSRGGGRDVLLLRDTTRPEIERALDAVPSGRSIILYVAGPASPQGALVLRDGSMLLSEMVAALSRAGAAQVALLLETCAHGRSIASDFALPDPDTIPSFVAASAAPGESCPAKGNRLSDRVNRAGAAATLQLAVAGLLLRDDGLPPVPIAQAEILATSPIAPSAPSLGREGDVVLISPVSPGSATTRVVQNRPAAVAAAGLRTLSTPPGSETVTEANFAPMGAGLGILPRLPGMPEPSLLIGFAERPPVQFDRAEDSPEAVATELSLDSLEARNALRESNFDLFQSLVESGAFDPPQGQIARALQAELARSGCYTSAIDGAWGPASRRAVEAYFDKHAEVTAVSFQAELPLYRQILLLDDVICEAPAPAAAAAPRAPAPQTTRARPAAPQTARPAPPQPAQPAAPARPTLGTGVFR